MRTVRSTLAVLTLLPLALTPAYANSTPADIQQAYETAARNAGPGFAAARGDFRERNIRMPR